MSLLDSSPSRKTGTRPRGQQEIQRQAYITKGKTDEQASKSKSAGLLEGYIRSASADALYQINSPDFDKSSVQAGSIFAPDLKALEDWAKRYNTTLKFAADTAQRKLVLLSPMQSLG